MADNQGDRVELLREKIKLNKKEFSKVIGYDHTNSYDAIVRGSRRLSIKILFALNRYDNSINLHWLLTGKGTMFIKEAEKTTLIQSNNAGNVIGSRVIVTKSEREEVLEIENRRLRDEVDRLKDEIISLLKESRV